MKKDKRCKVLLYSAGLDSFILSKIKEFDVKLFILTGAEDNNVEFENVKRRGETDITFFRAPHIGKLSLENGIIPFRNYHFVTIAASFGHDIYLGAVKGDVMQDNTFEFSYLISEALSHYSYNSKSTDTPFPGTRTINLPLAYYTKKEAVKRYLRLGLNPQDLTSTVSCHFPVEGKECGKCRACIRKYIALTLNKVPVAFQMQKDVLFEFKDACIQKGRFVEIEDIDKVLRLL